MASMSLLHQFGCLLWEWKFHCHHYYRHNTTIWLIIVSGCQRAHGQTEGIFFCCCCPIHAPPSEQIYLQTRLQLPNYRHPTHSGGHKEGIGIIRLGCPTLLPVRNGSKWTNVVAVRKIINKPTSNASSFETLRGYEVAWEWASLGGKWKKIRSNKRNGLLRKMLLVACRGAFRVILRFIFIFLFIFFSLVSKPPRRPHHHHTCRAAEELRKCWNVHIHTRYRKWGGNIIHIN